MGGLLGRAKGNVGPLQNYWGGEPAPPSFYPYVLILMHSEQPKLHRVLTILRAIELNVTEGAKLVH